MLLLTLLEFSRIASSEFSDIVRGVEVHDDRLRLYLQREAILEVRYPVENKYSFHLRINDEIYRIDTAPHHPGIPSYPRHIHFKREEVVVEDRITSFGNTPAENFRKVMRWIKELLEERV